MLTKLNKKCNFSSFQIVKLTKQTELSERQVERWWRRRRAQDKPTTLVKFSENSWRCIYYTYSFIFGCIVMWDKPWLWDIKNCWYGYPHQSVSNDIWWYYMISMAFYWSLTASQFVDVKRKDFWQMFIHHMITILLMALSWVCNLHRVGSLVLLVHDCADIFLEVMYYRISTNCFELIWHLIVGSKNHKVCTIPEGLRYDLRRFHCCLDHHTACAISSNHL